MGATLGHGCDWQNNAKGAVLISDVHVWRRVFPWPNQPLLRTSEAPLDSDN
jgi:hypothetical protein